MEYDIRAGERDQLIRILDAEIALVRANLEHIEDQAAHIDADEDASDLGDDYDRKYEHLADLQELRDKIAEADDNGPSVVDLDDWQRSAVDQAREIAREQSASAESDRKPDPQADASRGADLSSWEARNPGENAAQLASDPGEPDRAIARARADLFRLEDAYVDAYVARRVAELEDAAARLAQARGRYDAAPFWNRRSERAALDESKRQWARIAGDGAAPRSSATAAQLQQWEADARQNPTQEVYDAWVRMEAAGARADPPPRVDGTTDQVVPPAGAPRLASFPAPAAAAQHGSGPDRAGGEARDAGRLHYSPPSGLRGPGIER